MVGGNIPGRDRTISIDIYDQVQTANYSSANKRRSGFLVISFVVLSVVVRPQSAPLGVWSMAVKILIPARPDPLSSTQPDFLRTRSPHSEALPKRRRQLHPEYPLRALAGFTILFGASGAANDAARLHCRLTDRRRSHRRGRRRTLRLGKESRYRCLETPNWLCASGSRAVSRI